MDIEFANDFVWGVSSSAYQIEGAWNEDAKGLSIWDKFSQTTGKTHQDATGNEACEHYYRYKEDLALMADLGLRAYRFSTAWTRLFPEGRGKANIKGRDFYDRLIDELLSQSTDPWLCFYHWDLPLALQDKGGWQNRDMVYWFSDYAAYVAEYFGDRVKHFVMLNEPNVASQLGYLLGVHAPAIADPVAAATVTHHFNLATGMTIERLRSMNATWQLGTILNMQALQPEKDTDEDIEAAQRFDAVQHQNFLDPLLKGRYPQETQSMFQDLVRDSDLKQIQQPIDYLGINYFTLSLIKADNSSVFGLSQAEPESKAGLTDMGWEVYPEGLFEVLMRFKEDYGNPKLFITGNGAAYPDSLSPYDEVHDEARIHYFERHLVSLKRAIDKGANVHGYFAWTLLDNFEWTEGYSKRFGLTFVDFETQKRFPKASFKWYQALIRQGGFTMTSEVA